MIQQDLAPADLDDQILRDQGHVAGINVFAPVPSVSRDVAGPMPTDISLGKRGGGNALPIDKCAIVAVQVNNLYFPSLVLRNSAWRREILRSERTRLSSASGRSQAVHRQVQHPEVGRRSTLSRSSFC